MSLTEVKVSSVGGQKVIEMEAYVVLEISSIQNDYVQLARNEYPHLKDLWFSDVFKAQEELEIDILVGTDYLWDFQRECTIREKPDEPVALHTELGRVLSGPMKGELGTLVVLNLFKLTSRGVQSTTRYV